LNQNNKINNHINFKEYGYPTHHQPPLHKTLSSPFQNPKHSSSLQTKPKRATTLTQSSESISIKELKSSFQEKQIPKLLSINTNISSHQDILNSPTSNQPKQLKKTNNAVIPINKQYGLEIKFISTAGISHGQTKTNQDSVMVNKLRAKDKMLYLFGVFDGHGSDGHFVSQHVKSYFKQFLSVEINSDKKSMFDPNKMPKMIHEACKKLDKDIKKINGNNSSLKSSLKFSLGSNSNFNSSSKFDSSLSGSTCSLVILCDNMFWSVSLGDSKTILVLENKIKNINKNSFFPFSISKIHSTANKSEQKRVIKEGGRVEQVLNDNLEHVGPLRVWDSKIHMPGLQVTRSFGDFYGKKYGISAVPEINVYNFKESMKAMVVATDGLWDVMSEQETVEVLLHMQNFKVIFLYKFK
jgi:serine/threonine protein phosphatase PrpC